MDYGRQLLPANLDQAIDDAIATSSGTPWAEFVARNSAGDDAPDACAGRFLAVKYMPSARAAQYLKANTRLYIGGDYTFTWGKAVYVTGINEPLSTAIYGRVGIVTSFDTHHPPCRVFDARDPDNQKLFLAWLQLQTLYSPALLTVHSHYYLHQMRNIFRSQFRIDVVMCRPDEVDAYQWYTKGTDTWLAVSDWLSPGELKGGDADTANNYSDRFHDVRVVIIPEEEFVADNPALTRSPQFALNSYNNHWQPPTPQDIRQAYYANVDPASQGPQFVRVLS